MLATAGTAWPVSPITESAAGTPAATSINTAGAASNAVQVVDPNEVNELDRATIVESSWVNYLLWMLGAALAAAFAMWFFSRMRFLFGRRILGATVSGVTRVLLLLRLQLNKKSWNSSRSDQTPQCHTFTSHGITHRACGTRWRT